MSFFSSYIGAAVGVGPNPGGGHENPGGGLDKSGRFLP